MTNDVLRNLPRTADMAWRHSGCALLFAMRRIVPVDPISHRPHSEEPAHDEGESKDHRGNRRSAPETFEERQSCHRAADPWIGC